MADRFRPIETPPRQRRENFCREHLPMVVWLVAVVAFVGLSGFRVSQVRYVAYDAESAVDESSGVTEFQAGETDSLAMVAEESSELVIALPVSVLDPASSETRVSPLRELESLPSRSLPLLSPPVAGMSEAATGSVAASGIEPVELDGATWYFLEYRGSLGIGEAVADSTRVAASLSGSLVGRGGHPTEMPVRSK